MPVKKTPVKKATTKTTSKPTSKTVEKKISIKEVETKKPHVIVETKKTQPAKCECQCGCEGECKCGICKCIMHRIIVVLLVANLVFAALNLFVKKDTRDIETARVGGPENMEKVIVLYGSDYYKSNQTEGINASLAQIEAQTQDSAAGEEATAE